VGGVVGWFIHDHVQERNMATAQLTENLARPAAFAHVVYSSEVVHPVEVTAAQEQHLIMWLSKRLKTSLRAPTLIDHGYQLMGGRLLPSTDRMAAQFMYQDARGQRITLYVRRGAWESEASAFRYSHDGAIGTFYWIDGPVGYALSGDVERGQLLTLAETIYRQLMP
jgi:anti-sigma factor RsiW